MGERLTSEDQARARIAERICAILAGEGSLRTELRSRIAVEDGSFPLGAAADAFDAAEQLGAGPDAALAAATAVALIDGFAQVRAGTEPGDEAGAINAGDLFLSLAFSEARQAGAVVLERTLDACVAWIETRDREALARSACAIGEAAAGASIESMQDEQRKTARRDSA